MRDASDLNRELLEGGHSSVAGRLAGALRASGRGEFADNILATMRAAGYVVNETNPFSVAPPTLDEVTIMHSYLFKGATVVDGASSPPFRADVALEGDRIALIAPRINSPASKVIDADGLILAPGFIDIHSHTDATIFKHPLAESKVFQGVTTEVTGNCGLGPFPVETGREQELVEYLTLHDFDLHGERFQWNDFASYADYLDRLGIGINIAPLVGHAPLRIAVMGMENRKPAAFELERMQQLLSSALIQGAWGLSTGLIYPPGCYASTDELIALAKILAPHKALFSSHIRNEGDGLMDALDEAIAIGRESGSRVQISHLKAMGRSNRGKGKEILEKLTEARAFGINISADQYPYDASATSLTAVVPQWALAGGIAPLLERLRTPELREKLQAEIGREMAKREGAQGIFISNCRSEKNRRFSGKSIAILAEAWECLPEEAVVRLLIEEKGAVGAIFFSMSEDDVATILADSQISVGSDGHGLNAADALGEATHPRSYGCFTRVLGRYVREENMLSLATAVHKMSGLPASRLGFTDRGIIRQGFAADLSLFDPATIGDPADYTDPHQYSIGIAHLLIAGEPVIWDHKLTGMKPGRVLRLHDR